MAIDPYTKQAMWENFNKRCFYCRENLPFKNIQIDHIIPSVSFENFGNEMRKKYKLASGFDFNSLDNLAPACQSCNSNRKRGKDLENGVPLWLEEVARRRNEILKDARKIKSELSLDLPDEYKEFFLSSPDFLLSDLSIERIRKVDIELYKNLAFNPSYYPLHLTSSKDEKEKVLVTNLKQYESHRNKGYHPNTTPEIGLSSKCEACLTFFEKFEKAVAVEDKISLIDYYRDLPAKLLHVLGPEEDFDFKNFDTIGQYIDSKKNISIEITGTSIQIIITHKEYNERELYIFEEVLQAIFSGDDNREAILFVNYRSGSTFHYPFAVLASLIDNHWVVKGKL